MSLRNEIDSFLQELEWDVADENGQRLTLVWKGLSFPCVTSTLKRGTEILRGGHAEVIQLTAYVRKSYMRTPLTVDSTVLTLDNDQITTDSNTGRPKSRDRVDHKEKAYRVLTVGEPAPGSHWEFDLGSVNR